MHQKTLLTVVCIAVIGWLADGVSAADEYSQLAGVMHVHSTYSSGDYSIEELVSTAGKKGLEVLVLTDHDLVVMEYGLFPFRNLIKKREERKSVLQIGPEHYLADIERLNKQQHSVLIIPGVQSSPFYYWRGNPLKKRLSAVDYRKELLLIGLFEPEDYYGLPLLHGGFSTRNVKALMPRVIVFFAAFLLSLYLVFQKGKFRIYGIAVALLSLVLMINHQPFKSSRFDPYHGDQGIAPFQDVIDYAHSRGGLAFWAHPESNYSKNGVQLGPVKMMTGHYPEDLIESKNYTGFSALYGDSASAANPGKHWDQILIEYCKGSGAHPVWGIAGADFHGEENGVALDTFQTVFLVREKSTASVLQALAHGKIYAVSKIKDMRLSLDQFLMKDKATGNTAIMGEELKSYGLPIIEGRLSASDGGRYMVRVSIVRGGKIVWTFEGKTPLDFNFVDEENWSGKTFYRLEAKGRTAGQLLSNPIFVVKRDKG